VNYFFLDASAWVKRFHQEPGSDIINSSDALYLRQAVVLRRLLQRARHDLVLVASDRRLLRAATGEGIAPLDPEVASLTEVDSLIGLEADEEHWRV